MFVKLAAVLLAQFPIAIEKSSEKVALDLAVRVDVTHDFLHQRVGEVRWCSGEISSGRFWSRTWPLTGRLPHS